MTDYKTLTLSQYGAVATIAINNGPINILDVQLLKDLYKAGVLLAEDDSVKVIIMESANPEFFIAHADVNLIMALTNVPQPDGVTPSMMQQLTELYRHMPKVTIGKLDGIARGGGSEILLALDMRFAAKGKALIGQPEAALGVIAGGGGCTRLPKLMGRGRAMEVLLGCDDFDAELAERYGYINRAIADDELSEFVETLAQRIASYPSLALIKTKQTVNQTEAISAEQLGAEYLAFHQTANAPGMTERMQQALTLGLQTPEVESKNLNELIQQLD